MNPELLLKEMKSIEYGWLDKSGNIHKKIDKDVFMSLYTLQTPEEVRKNSIGLCWDQVELEREFFEDSDILHKVLMIIYYDNDKMFNHTFLTFEDNGKFYWFENSWENQKGIHEFNTYEELLNHIKKFFIVDFIKIDEYKDEYIKIIEYVKPIFKIGCMEFYMHCLKGKEYKLSSH